MEKKRSASSARGRQAAMSVRHIPDSQIDFSDIPELTDEPLKRMRRVGRPATGMAKQLIAIRLSPTLQIPQIHGQGSTDADKYSAGNGYVIETHIATP